MSRRDHFMLRIKGATKIDMGRARGAPRIEEEDAAPVIAYTDKADNLMELNIKGQTIDTVMDHLKSFSWSMTIFILNVKYIMVK